MCGETGMLNFRPKIKNNDTNSRNYLRLKKHPCKNYLNDKLFQEKF